MGGSRFKRLIWGKSIRNEFLKLVMQAEAGYRSYLGSIGASHEWDTFVAECLQELALDREQIAKDRIFFRSEAVFVTVVGGLKVLEGPWRHILEFRVF